MATVNYISSNQGSLLESDNFIYHMTCYACPEQYNVYDKKAWDAGEDNKMMAYIRLRHSRLTVECPDCGDDIVFTCEFDDPGDENHMKGMFNGDEERLDMLSRIDDILCDRYNLKK